jgi:eukaryotic-like serine/threonine-protein kinase
VNMDRRFVGDRYELTSLLATGGMGQVWRARDLALERPVAVKVLRPTVAVDAAAVTRFEREARLSAGLAHPNIATVHDYGEASLTPGRFGDRVAFLVMELVDGEPLSAVLQREGRLAPDRTLEIVRQTAAGLAAAHAAGVVHRDVKPGNLLLGPDGSVKITDFGIAWSRSSDPLTGTGDVMGTAQYLSPEQAKGAMAGPASDVYALGTVAYECLAGRRPFEGASAVQVALMHANRTPDALPADVPDRVRDLVARMLAKDPEERFADGDALLSAVEDVLAAPATASSPDRHATTVLRSTDPAPAPAVRRGLRTTASRRSRHAAPSGRAPRRLLVPLVAMVALVAILTAALGGADSKSVPVAGSTSSPTTANAIHLAAEDYLGRPVGEVAAELTSLGVSVRLRELRTASAADGAVLAVGPTGEISPGQAVTVTHAVPLPTEAPAPAPAEEQGGVPAPAGTGDGTADVGTEGSTSQTATAPESSARPGSSGRAFPAGRANGRGNG